MSELLPAHLLPVHNLSVRKFRELIVKALDETDKVRGAKPTREQQYALLELGPGRYVSGSFWHDGLCCPAYCVSEGVFTSGGTNFGVSFDNVVAKHFDLPYGVDDAMANFPLILDVRRTFVDRLLGY